MEVMLVCSKSLLALSQVHFLLALLHMDLTGKGLADEAISWILFRLLVPPVERESCRSEYDSQR